MAVRKERISEAIEKEVAAELINREGYLQGANEYFKSELAKIKAA